MNDLYLNDDFYKGAVSGYLEEKRIKDNRRAVINFILSIIGFILTLYIVGFVICLGAFLAGGDGSDLLTQHYRSIISLIIK